MHKTVREFFRPEGPTTWSKFWINRIDANREISITCIQYLMLCGAKISSIDQVNGGKPWTTEHFEAYAQYLNRRPFFKYALEYAERHLQQCSRVAGDLKLISQLCKVLDDRPAAYILGNWIPQAWGQRIPGHEQPDNGKDFRAKLLHAATRMKYSEVVEALLIAGAEVDASLGGKTLLMVAAEGGDLVAARVLLDRGALVGVRDDSGRTALHLAAANGHNLVVGLLVDRGAEKEAEDSKRQRALHLAAANGHESIIRLLVDRGADKRAKDVLGWEALHSAAWNGHNTTIQMLVKSLDANMEEKDKGGWTALHVATVSGHNATIRLLVENLGADKNAKDNIGWTALHFAAAFGLKDTTQLLSKTLDVNKNAQNKEGETALNLAQKL